VAFRILEAVLLTALVLFLVLGLAAIAPASTQPCPGNPLCTCGCNSGRHCTCKWADGTPVCPPARPVARVPVACPSCRPKAVPVGDPVAEAGVDLSRVATDRVTYRRGDRELTRDEALAAVSQSIPRDEGLLRITVIGPASACVQVQADLANHAALARYKGRVVVQAYRPDHPLIQGLGFVTSGNPVIYIQAPNGAVLHRQNDYRGAEKLAEAIRKADPSYDPAKDPDLNAPQPLKLPFQLPKVPDILLLGAAGLGAYLLLRKDA
jgi:hypothetical protein